MWFFKKDKEVKNQVTGTKAQTLKDQKAQELLAIMRTARAEIGEENLQNIVKKIKLDDLKKKVQNDIVSDERKRDKLLDAIRYEMTDKQTKH
jgi:hypothetical protein